MQKESKACYSRAELDSVWQLKSCPFMHCAFFNLYSKVAEMLIRNSADLKIDLNPLNLRVAQLFPSLVDKNTLNYQM